MPAADRPCRKDAGMILGAVIRPRCAYPQHKESSLFFDLGFVFCGLEEGNWLDDVGWTTVLALAERCE